MDYYQVQLVDVVLQHITRCPLWLPGMALPPQVSNEASMITTSV